MPFISTKDNRELSQGLTPYEPIPEAGFGEVFSAGFGFVADEEMSISMLLNNEGLTQRKRQVKELADAGTVNIDAYTDVLGSVDYDKLSADNEGMGIRTDRELFEEKAEVLRRRREHSKDLFERGSGMAQFLGMASAYALDPVNLATLPIATAATSAKSLTVLGRALTVARNEAGLAIAAELLIQPLVYKHKHDIDSPYSATDALVNLGMAATGASMLGGITGGVSGYFKKVREAAATQVLDKDALAAMENLVRMEESLQMGRKTTHYSDIADDYAAFKQGEVDSIVDLRSKSVADMENRLVELQRSGKRTGQEIGEMGGLNREAWESEGIDPVFFTDKSVKGGFGKPVFRKTGGMTPDDLAEQLWQRGMIRSVDANQAIDFVDRFLREGDEILDADIRGQVDLIENDLMNMRSADHEILESIYQDAVKRNIDNDIDFIREMESKMESSNPPSKRVDDYTPPPPKKAPSGTIHERQRAALSERGLDADYDADIARFNELENARMVQDGDLVSADDFMKSLDDEIDGINDILRCTLGQL